MFETNFENDENKKLIKNFLKIDECDKDWQDELQCRILFMIKKMSMNKVTKPSPRRKEVIKIDVHWAHNGKMFDLDIVKSHTVTQVLAQINQEGLFPTSNFGNTNAKNLALDVEPWKSGTYMSGNISSYNLKDGDKIYFFVSH